MDAAPWLEPVADRGQPGLPLFVYGTLQPGEARWFALDGRVVGDPTPDAVSGRLYDTGWDYPAWVPGSDGVVPGVVLVLDPASAAETWAHVCEIEGGVQGEYGPVRTRTVAGVEVLAFPYHVPPGATVPATFTRIVAWRHGPVPLLAS